jgi:hypothetical protein
LRHILNSAFLILNSVCSGVKPSKSIFWAPLREEAFRSGIATAGYAGPHAKNLRVRIPERNRESRSAPMDLIGFY